MAAGRAEVAAAEDCDSEVVYGGGWSGRVAGRVEVVDWVREA